MSSKKKDNKLIVWIRNFWVEVLIAIVGLVAINLIFLAEAFTEIDKVSAQGAGQLGDFVGGYVGTLFALFSVVLLAHTLKVQREATRLVSFESRYFELLKLHRENVSEIKLRTILGRRFFVFLIREFRAILEVVSLVGPSVGQELTANQRIVVAYYCLYIGVGPNSTRTLRETLNEFTPEFVDALVVALVDKDRGLRVRKRLKLGYKPFEGHQSRLGHYYRHLYQSVAYVDDQRMSDEDKYGYVKTLRAQLSNHEQALLLLNSLTPLGRNWWSKEFILRYRLVKNIPAGFFDPYAEFDIVSLMPVNYFEWQAIERMSTGSAVPELSRKQ